MLIHTPADLATFYRDQRRERGLSQSAVGQDISLRQDTVSKFEIKPDNTRLETLFRLLAALDLELHLVPKGSSGHDPEQPGWTEPW